METREKATATTRVAGSRHCWSGEPGNSAAAVILCKCVRVVSHRGEKFVARLDCGIDRLLPELSHKK
jgi:hypothetical protein